jgi:hypothetical protein
MPANVDTVRITPDQSAKDTGDGDCLIPQRDQIFILGPTPVAGTVQQSTERRSNEVVLDPLLPWG